MHPSLKNVAVPPKNCNRGRMLQDWERPNPPKVPGRVLGRVPGKGGVLGGLLGAVLGGHFLWKSRETALLPAVPPALPFFPALFPALSPALLGDSGFLSPVAGGPDCNPRSDFCVDYASWRNNRERKMNKLVFLKLFGHLRDIPTKSRDIPPKKFGNPGFRGTYRTFRPPPLHVEDPHPIGGYLDPKVWVWVLFSWIGTV